MNRSQDSSRPAVQSNPKARDDRIDKAKGILIFLVVAGHFLEQISGWDMEFSRVLLTTIYSFHMPAFVLLAGITAKSNRLIDRILVFVVLLATSHPIFYYWNGSVGKAPDLEFTEPYWITWFLLAMIWWILLLPLVERFPKQMLVISLAVGIFGGAIPFFDYELSIGRTMTFFPFFVIGKLYGKQLLNFMGRQRLGSKLGLTVAAFVPIIFFFIQHYDHRWFYGGRGFSFLEEPTPFGVGMRVLIGGSAMLTILALFAWAEWLPDFMTIAGKHSLAIYLLHGLIVKAMDKPLDVLLDATSGSVALVACLLAAAIVTWVLSWQGFERAIRWYSTSVAQLMSRLIPSARPRRRPRH